MPQMVGYPVAKPGLCFLDLPYKVRRRIYILARLVRVCPINLNNEGADRTGDEPITKDSAAGREIIEDWYPIARQLLVGIQPNRLRLSLVCDTLDQVTAKQILCPLFRMPTLAECAIRLGQAPNHDLRRLADSTILHVTDRPRPRTGFRFLDLPEELQVQILSNSDLIAPKPIEWIAGRLPKAIFLVSHEIHDKATQLFYSRNQFKVHTLHVDAAWDDDDWLGSDHKGVLRFLRALPPQALPYIRELSCLFPYLRNKDFEAGTACSLNWRATWDFVAQNLVVSRLSLTIHDISSSGFNPTHIASVEEDEENFRLAREDAEWECYQRMIDPLVHLAPKPKGFYVNLCCQFIYGYSDLRWSRAQTLEQMVMGQNYDSDEDGNYAEDDRPSKELVPEKRVYGPDGVQIWPFDWNSQFPHERITY
ncbi:hypothetical protein MMC18_001325 [Xylographa bjoerkii]|nr:hypothetical protein [Xylographa bjoerkii]